MYRSGFREFVWGAPDPGATECGMTIALAFNGSYRGGKFSMDQDSVAGQDQKICRRSEVTDGGGIEPDWELLERLTRQESIGVAIVLAVTTAMAAAIKLSGF